MNISLAGILPNSLVNGEGLRYVIFTQGCSHNCPNCHNPSTHDISKGTPYNIDSLIEMVKHNTKGLHNNVTISGGDPFLQYEALEELVVKLNRLGYNIWVYTGYTLEYLESKPDKYDKILKNINVLIDGEYIEELHSSNIRYRGSNNQRIIDIQETIRKREISLYAS